jgi:hypothetical protein
MEFPFRSEITAAAAAFTGRVAETHCRSSPRLSPQHSRPIDATPCYGDASSSRRCIVIACDEFGYLCAGVLFFKERFLEPSTR